MIQPKKTKRYNMALSEVEGHAFSGWPKKACPDTGRIRVILLIRGQTLLLT